MNEKKVYVSPQITEMGSVNSYVQAQAPTPVRTDLLNTNCTDPNTICSYNS
jgi:hypothetical protein